MPSTLFCNYLSICFFALYAKLIREKGFKTEKWTCIPLKPVFPLIPFLSPFSDFPATVHC